jgi:hypothetical protein
MEEKKKIKVIVHNNTDTAHDRDAQRVILDYYKNINESGHKKFYDFLKKSGQKIDEYEAIFYLSNDYHPKHTDKFYSNKIHYKTNVADAYKDALEGYDDESPSFIRIYVKNGIKGLVAITEFDVYNDYVGDKYDERGYLKEEIKQGAIEYLKKELLINEGMEDKFDNGGEIESSDIEKKIEERIKDRQKSKEFKDTSVVGYTRKYSAAYDIITSADLSKIEVDNVTAYKLIEKSKIWLPYNVETLKAQGNSSGCAYLKVKTREALSARPIDTKLGREVYVKNIEKLIGLLEPCKIVSDVQDVLKDFVNLDSFDFIDLSNLKDANYMQTSSVGNLKNHYQRDVLNYFEDIFGKRFYAFCRFTSESARKIAVEANLYQAFPKAYRDIIVANRISDLSSKLAKFEKMLAMVSDDADENRKNTREFDENYSGVAYGKDYVTDYYKMRIDSYKTNLENVDSKLSKIYDTRENDWSWSGEKTKKGKVEVDALDKVAKEPLTIMEQYGIEDWRKSAKRQPLAYIKRTGGLNVNDISTKEIQDKFGYRNVIFGNYVNDKESKEHSRHFIGAMLDLHEIMNLNVKQLNEIGGLDINFGSTGCGSFSLAMACYFRENKAINLTKKTGDGSVAHEWSHYLDNVLGEGSDRGATGRKMATEDKVSYKNSDKIKYLFSEWNNWLRNGGENKEVEIEYPAQKKFKFRISEPDLESAIAFVKKRYAKSYDNYENSSSQDCMKLYGYLAHKFNNDKPITVTFKTNATSYYVISSNYGQGYWNSSVELFARSFEWAIEELLKRKDRVSNYLVDTVNSMGLMGFLIPYHLHPYPRVKEEQEWLLDWFDRLFSAIRTEYSVAPFHWDTVERTDEYLEYENKKTDVIAEGVIISEETGEAEVIGEDVEYRENGYSFKRNNINGTSLYTVLVNDKASDFYIGTSENYGVKSDSGYSKKGWVILTKLPNEEKYSTISYFKSLKEAQDILVNEVKIEPVKVEDLPKPKSEYIKREEVKFTPISAEAKQFIPSNQYGIIKTNPEFEDARIRINELVATCPKTYETEGLETNKKLAQLHYFRGGSDWYIIEKDSETEQLQAFGYVILNGDTENAEFGYINIEEVKKYAEIDLYWTPINLGKIRGESEEFTKEEYLSALEGAEATLEFLEGKEKQDLVDYIEGLKIIINLD